MPETLCEPHAGAQVRAIATTKKVTSKKKMNEGPKRHDLSATFEATFRMDFDAVFEAKMSAKRVDFWRCGAPSFAFKCPAHDGDYMGT